MSDDFRGAENFVYPKNTLIHFTYADLNLSKEPVEKLFHKATS